MKKIVKRFEKMMLVSMGVNVLDILIGILFILVTSLATKINVLILGALILVHGIFYVIRYLYDGFGIKVFAVDLIIGVAAIILGVFTMFNPFDALSSIGILFGIWLAFLGIENMCFAYKFFRKQEEIYPLVTFIALLVILMGILVAFNPFETFMLITRLIGIFLICSGLFGIMRCNLFKRRAQAILEIFK